MNPRPQALQYNGLHQLLLLNDFRPPLQRRSQIRPYQLNLFHHPFIFYKQRPISRQM